VAGESYNESDSSSLGAPFALALVRNMRLELAPPVVVELHL